MFWVKTLIGATTWFDNIAVNEHFIIAKYNENGALDWVASIPYIGEMVMVIMYLLVMMKVMYILPGPSGENFLFRETFMNLNYAGTMTQLQSILLK